MFAWYLMFVLLPAASTLIYHGWWTLRPPARVGRHRGAGRVTWRAERRMRECNERSRGNKVEYAALMRSVRRVNDWLDETPTVVLEAVPEWNQPTKWEIPDLGEAQRITYGRGAAKYRDLLTRTLDDEAAEALRLIRTVRFEDVTDERYAEVTAR